MEGSGRKLGWIAIALSVVALMVSIGGRAHERFDDRRGFYAPQAPAPQQAPAPPRGQFGPQDRFGPQDQFGPQDRFGPQDQRGQFGPQDRFESRDRFDPRGGRRPFFLLPLMLIGGLFKLLFVALLIGLGLRLIKGKGFGGPWGRGPGGRGEHKSQSDPEQPPYTGDTQQM